MVKFHRLQLNPNSQNVAYIPFEYYGIVALSFKNNITGVITIVDYTHALYLQLFKSKLIPGQLATKSFLTSGVETLLENAFNRGTAIDLSGDSLPNVTPYLDIVEYIPEKECNCNN